jgi:hypothetical protein
MPGHGALPVQPNRAALRQVPMQNDRLAAAKREFVLDQILTDLWKGKLTREAAVGRIIAKLGMSERAARDEIAGFLRD